MPPGPAAFPVLQLLALVVFALLVGNAAAGLAGRLAGSLALAAAALHFAQIAGLDGLDMLHDHNLLVEYLGLF